jgi:hypothetical protein
MRMNVKRIVPKGYQLQALHNAEERELYVLARIFVDERCGVVVTLYPAALAEMGELESERYLKGILRRGADKIEELARDRGLLK